MILENACLRLGSKGLSYVSSFLVREHNSTKIFIYTLIVIEETRVLNKHVDWAAKDRPRFTVNRVTMSCCLHFRTSFMDGRIWERWMLEDDANCKEEWHTNIESCCVDGCLRSFSRDISIRTNKNEHRFLSKTQVNRLSSAQSNNSRWLSKSVRQMDSS